MKKKQAYDSIIDVIGHTPLVRLNQVAGDIPGEVFAKLEFLNPMGSSKDRIARHMIEKAEREGKIKKGDLIIENSSGNTAMGLALIAIQKGYRLKVVVRDRISREKLDQLKALGVEIHMVDSSLPPEHPDSYNNITPRLARETPNCFFPDQHNNRDNNEAHYLGTGPEIWEQMAGRIDFFVAGIGTGGTVGGTARFLKEKDPGIQVVAVDPVGSVFYEYFHTKKLVQARTVHAGRAGRRVPDPLRRFQRHRRHVPGDRQGGLPRRQGTGAARGDPRRRLERRGPVGRAPAGEENKPPGAHRHHFPRRRLPLPEHDLQRRLAEGKRTGLTYF